jgi:hypothetical protein
MLSGRNAVGIWPPVYWYFQNRGGMDAAGAEIMAVYGFTDWQSVVGAMAGRRERARGQDDGTSPAGLFCRMSAHSRS